MPIVQLMDIDKFVDPNSEVSSANILTTKGKFDNNGLFSETIFGLNNSKDRSKKYGYICLHTKILHPFMFEVYKKIEEKVILLIEGNTMFYDEINKVLSKDNNKEGTLKEVSGFDGAMYCIKHGINYRGDTDVRFKIIERLQEQLDNGLAFIDKVIVIPPTYRQVQLTENGEIAGMDDLNTLYVKLLNESKKIQMVSDNNDDTTGQMSDNALIRRQIQFLVNEIYLVGKTKPAKKFGVGRGQLLGKRVDFSARSAMTAGPDIPVGYLGVPYRIIANISQPFLIHYFSKELSEGSQDYETLMTILEKNDFDKSNNVLIITNWLKDVSQNKCKMSEKEEKWLMEKFQSVLSDKYVLMKRDPSVHKGSWQSYKPMICNGNTMRFPIAQTGFHNLDFDGDSIFGKVRLRIG